MLRKCRTEYFSVVVSLVVKFVNRVSQSSKSDHSRRNAFERYVKILYQSHAVHHFAESVHFTTQAALDQLPRGPLGEEDMSPITQPGRYLPSAAWPL